MIKKSDMFMVRVKISDSSWLIPMILVKIQSILAIKADILVLSANPSLLAGSGISGLIHKAAGPQLEAAAKTFATLTPG